MSYASVNTYSSFLHVQGVLKINNGGKQRGFKSATTESVENELSLYRELGADTMAGCFIFAYLLSLVLVANVRGQVCGTAANQPCNATQIFSSFEMSYLAESTSQTSQGVCTYLVRESEEIVDGKANFSLLTRPEAGTDVRRRLAAVKTRTH
ncbi:hypothetical protein V5799_008097 [Amblyomma americanum]|uniref:Uncharacterized protein n=1 Tax=Amblyomma americanum TaxID=6943 RepID=A0AAQ4FE95_AMBAM